jgi:hypothetical protein
MLFEHHDDLDTVLLIWQHDHLDIVCTTKLISSTNWKVWSSLMFIYIHILSYLKTHKRSYHLELLTKLTFCIFINQYIMPVQQVSYGPLIMSIMSCYTGFFNVRKGWQSLNMGPRFYLRLIRRTVWLWIYTSHTTDERPWPLKGHL